MEDTARYLEEICLRAASRNIFLFSRFLNLSEQKDAQIAARRAGAAFVLFGGAEDCERKMLGVGGDEAPEGYLFPLVCLKVTPRSTRFASPIAHRDVLGSLMEGRGVEAMALVWVAAAATASILLIVKYLKSERSSVKS